jgi:hypothetical protein
LGPGQPGAAGVECALEPLNRTLTEIPCSNWLASAYKGVMGSARLWAVFR